MFVHCSLAERTGQFALAEEAEKSEKIQIFSFSNWERRRIQTFAAFSSQQSALTQNPFHLLFSDMTLVADGSFLSFQGTYIACQQILSSTSTATDPDQPIRSLMPAPIIVNAITLLVPAACVVFAVPLAIISGYQWRHAYHGFQALQKSILASPSTSPTAAERDSAASVWKDFADSLRTVAIGFLIWCILACFFALLVLVFGTFLIEKLNTHLIECRQNAKATYHQTPAVTAYWPNREVPSDAQEHVKHGEMTAKAKRAALS